MHPLASAAVTPKTLYDYQNIHSFQKHNYVHSVFKIPNHILFLFFFKHLPSGQKYINREETSVHSMYTFAYTYVCIFNQKDSILFKVRSQQEENNSPTDQLPSLPPSRKKGCWDRSQGPVD